MSVSLQKGQKVSLTKERAGLSRVIISLTLYFSGI